MQTTVSFYVDFADKILSSYVDYADEIAFAFITFLVRLGTGGVPPDRQSTEEQHFRSLLIILLVIEVQFSTSRMVALSFTQ